MILVTERHDVEIERDGESHLVASADLCSDDTLDDFRVRVVTIGGAHLRIADRDALGQAFDEAFERCEARPGDAASGVVEFAGGRVSVTRRLAA